MNAYVKPTHRSTKKSHIPKASHNFTPATVHAKRAYMREEIAVYNTCNVPCILGDYTYYSILEHTDGCMRTWFGEDGNVFAEQDDAENHKELLKQQYPDKKYILLHGRFSLDEDNSKHLVDYYDTVPLEYIDNPFEREWLRQTRERLARMVKERANIYEPDIDKSRKVKKLDGDTSFYRANHWFYFSIGIRHYAIYPFGIGSTPFFTLKEAQEYKSKLETKYPECEFYFMLGCMDMDGDEPYCTKPLEDYPNPREREWVRQHRERTARMLAEEASNACN